MTIRQLLEDREKRELSEYAALSVNTRGRLNEISYDDMRTEYQRDRDRIIHCKSFRRLMHKTQVFLSPEHDHYRTRLTHTLEVSQIARTIARSLMLNEDLCEAISLGHDLGHTPFGHVGERVLDSLSPHGFRHNEQSVRVVEYIEKDGKGLNLTFEVRDGILNHTKRGHPATLEGQAVSLADRIAYINHDISDALRAGVIRNEDLPEDVVKILGNSPSKRINTAISSIVESSLDQPFVRMGGEVAAASEKLRAFMFERVYHDANRSMQEKAERMLSALYERFIAEPRRMPETYVALAERFGEERAVCDYLSGMTDRYIEMIYEREGDYGENVSS